MATQPPLPQHVHKGKLDVRHAKRNESSGRCKAAKAAVNKHSSVAHQVRPFKCGPTVLDLSTLVRL